MASCNLMLPKIERATSSPVRFATSFAFSNVFFYTDIIVMPYGHSAYMEVSRLACVPLDWDRKAWSS